VIPAGSTFRCVVSGQYGPFEGLSAQSAITSTLNAQGIVVTNFVDNEPSLASQLLQGNWVSTPYQLTIDGQLTQSIADTSTLGSVIADAVSHALGTVPTSYSIVNVNGVQIANTPDAPVYATSQIANTVGSSVGSVLNTTTILILVAVVGLVLIAQSGSVRVHV
jgi:hypothetical protein